MEMGPPGFTSDDTSYEASLAIPSLDIGLPKIPEKEKAKYIASFRKVDISGTQLSSLFSSQTWNVIRSPIQTKNTPSKKI